MKSAVETRVVGGRSPFTHELADTRVGEVSMKRRSWLAATSLALFGAACGSSSTRGERAARRPLSNGGDPNTVLTLMPDTAQAREVLRGLADELGEEFRVVAVVVEGRAAAPVVARSFAEHRPRAVVLVNDSTVAAYRAYVSQSGGPRVPAVVVMTSFLDASALSAIGALGIDYEVPLITAVTSLRRILETPVERVGVVYRENLDAFVRREAELASREQIVVVPSPLAAEPDEAHVRSAIREAKQYADALWVPNDERVLSPELIADGWLPGLNERPWLPTVVSASALVSASQFFGTIAVLPDHTALGVQTANLVFDIADNRWQLPDRGAQLPLSTNTVVDLRQAHERFELKRDALAQVDKIIE